MEIALNCELSIAAEELKKLPITDPGLKNILENILYFGMPATAEKVLHRNGCQYEYDGEEDNRADK
jgi:hypothetical protein